jgi:drug/metabolite transporter (DMT)-like permease
LTLLALGLVVVGALIHAWWNLLAKHSEGGAHFVWSYSAVNAVLFMPLAVWALSTGGMKWTWLAMGMLLATGVLHLCYSLILQAGYRRAGLSVVYPVARGTGPALSVLGAIFFLGEHATVASAIGALLVVGGVLVIGLARRSGTGSSVWTGIQWGGLTGLFIAAYTLNDGAAVRLVGLSPIVVDYFGNISRTVMLAPVAWRNPAALRAEWRKNAKYILGIGALAPIPYILALYAMKMAPISLVAPARELSMLAGVFFGWHFLKEEDIAQRLVGAAFIAAGVVALSFS